MLYLPSVLKCSPPVCFHVTIAQSKVVSLQDKIKEYSKKTELVTAMMEKGYAFSAEVYVPICAL